MEFWKFGNSSELAKITVLDYHSLICRTYGACFDVHPFSTTNI
jgi:hypothetical protein